MKKIIFLALFCFVALSFAFGQSDDSKQTRVYRPDIPGSFKIDWGFLIPLDAPEKFSNTFFPSNSLNIYYQYPIRFGKSKFSFNPGAGFSFERFKFNNNVILDRVGQRYDLVAGSTRFSGIQKTILSQRFFDVPLEFRFDTKPEDVANSFNFALGGRAGFLIDAMMKVKHSENGQKITTKEKQNFGLTEFRYGVYTRMGIGSFNLFLFYNLSPMFQSGRGPDRTTMTTFSTGISINGF